MAVQSEGALRRIMFRVLTSCVVCTAGCRSQLTGQPGLRSLALTCLLSVTACMTQIAH